MRDYLRYMVRNLWNHLFRTKRGLFSQITLTLSACIIAFLVIGTALSMLMFFILSFGLPDVQNLREIGLEKSTIILDRNGKQLYSIHGEENRKYVPLSEMAPSLVKATLAIEDERFYNHPGVDYIAIVRAAVNNFLGFGMKRSIQGGSTITQQLAKNAFLSSERTLIRKMREVILAMRLERNFTKDEILELYLNKIPYGNNAFGVELAAQRYFDKSAATLALTESAILASLPKAPSRYSPYGNYKNSQLLVDPEALQGREIHTDADLETEEFVRGLIGATTKIPNGEVHLRGRADLVLNRMETLGFITEEEMERAQKETKEIEFKPYGFGIAAPHFIFYVRELLEAKYGKDMVEKGGLQVKTTLDLTLQEAAEEMIKEQGEINERDFGAQNAAIVAMDPKNGHIVAMVGSRDFFNEDIDGKVNVALRPRQPGSSFKPIVYAAAFRKGYGPGTVIYDVETKFQPGDEDALQPQNYDGTFRGPMTIREALGQSRNIPAIKAFFLAGGQEEIISLANRMGITTLKSGGNYGWPLGIGAGEVKLIEMVQAFAVFANQGKTQLPVSILKVEDAEGNVLEEWKENEQYGQKALEPEIAYLITDILSDASVNLGSRLNVPGRKIAVKTGTSNKRYEKDGKTVAREWEKDDVVLPNNLWAFGYSPSIVAGVWVGNAQGTAMKIGADGYNAAAPIWNRFIQKALENVPAEDWPVPENIRRVEISTLSGKLPSAKTPSDKIRSELFLKENVPEEMEDMYVEVAVDGITGKLATEFSPIDKVERRMYISYEPEYPNNVWREGIEKWFAEQEESKEGKLFYGPIPQEHDDLHTAETYANAPTIRIESPRSGTSVEEGKLEIRVHVEGGNSMEKGMVEFFLDDFQKDTARISPWTGSIPLRGKHADGKPHEIKTRVEDGLGYSAEAKVSIMVRPSS